MEFPISLNGFEQHGDRRAVYEALIGALAPQKYDVETRHLFKGAMAVAGYGPSAAATLDRYWPGGDHVFLFAHPRECLPRILVLASTSPHERYRGEVVHALPAPLTRTEFATWGFDDTTMPFPQRAMITAKLGEFELFAAMVDELARRGVATQQAAFIYSPPLTLDYLVGPEGPFIYLGDGGKGNSSLRITVEQLFAALAIPFELSSEQQSGRFKAIFGRLNTDYRDMKYMPYC